MSPISSEEADLSIVLRSLFSIPLGEIDDGLGQVTGGGVVLLRSLEKKFRRQKSGKIQPADLADSYHRRFLLGFQMIEVSILPEELILFSVSLPAYEIAEMACRIACNQGELGALGEFVFNCEESGVFSGYDRAVLRSEEILESIHDTLFVSALERYGLTRVAKLYENNRPFFELQIEVGRRLVSPGLVDLVEHQKIEADFRKKFGPEFLQELTRRLESHGLALG